MISFTASDAMEIAVKMEENGQKFYNRMAEKLNDPELKKLFLFLANEEVKHKALYNEILKKVGENQWQEDYPEEYYNYLNAYAEKIIFSNQRLDEEIGAIQDSGAALNFAIKAELEAVLYYEEIKKMVGKKDQEIIDQIIAEERRHFVQLTKLERSLV
jgi:rubrerythrin